MCFSQGNLVSFLQGVGLGAALSVDAIFGERMQKAEWLTIINLDN